MSKDIFEGMNTLPPEQSSLLGITHALQALAAVALDTPEKRAALRTLLDNLAEVALRSDMSPDRRQNYLDMLGSVGQSIEVSPLFKR